MTTLGSIIIGVCLIIASFVFAVGGAYAHEHLFDTCMERFDEIADKSVNMRKKMFQEMMELQKELEE